jgi:hypothetical protein
MPLKLIPSNLAGVKNTKFVNRAVKTFAVDTEQLYFDLELALRAH